MTTVTTTTFDTLLACLFPLAICIAAYRLRDSLGSFSDLRALVFPTKSSSQPYFSLERAYHSYRQYERLSKSEVSRMRASYSKLGRAHKRMANTLGYTKKLDRLWDITALNGTIADEIAEIAEREYPSVTDTPKYHATSADLARVREALKHFIRDWSDDGAKERHTIFSPILDCLKTVDPELRASQKVLVPGCGLGRLSWEISQLGDHLI
ncbi:N2227-domain-containing protein, partial [Coprinopsis marcescibilis]